MGVAFIARVWFLSDKKWFSTLTLRMLKTTLVVKITIRVAPLSPALSSSGAEMVSGTCGWNTDVLRGMHQYTDGSSCTLVLLSYN